VAKKAEKPSDNLEYNDGLGDLLREKDTLQFSWYKTAIVIASIVALIFLILTILFNFGKTMITDTSNSEYEINYPQAESEETMTAIERETHQLIEMVEEKLKEPTPIVIIPKTPRFHIKPMKTYTKTQRKGNSFKIIVGSFANSNNAKEMKRILAQKGVASFIWISKNKKQTLYKLQAGAYSSRGNAEKEKEKLGKKGIDSYIVTN